MFPWPSLAQIPKFSHCWGAAKLRAPTLCTCSLEGDRGSRATPLHTCISAHCIHTVAGDLPQASGGCRAIHADGDGDRGMRWRTDETQLDNRSGAEIHVWSCISAFIWLLRLDLICMYIHTSLFDGGTYIRSAMSALPSAKSQVPGQGGGG